MEIHVHYIIHDIVALLTPMTLLPSYLI